MCVKSFLSGRTFFRHYTILYYLFHLQIQFYVLLHQILLLLILYLPDKYAVMRKGRKTALRVLDSQEEAEAYRAEKGGDYIEERKGEDKKCIDYCLCCRKCDYWKQKNL